MAEYYSVSKWLMSLFFVHSGIQLTCVDRHLGNSYLLTFRIVKDCLTIICCYIDFLRFANFLSKNFWEVMDCVSSSTIPYKVAGKGAFSFTHIWIQNGTSFICLFATCTSKVTGNSEGGGGGVSKVKFVKKSMNLNWNF